MWGRRSFGLKLTRIISKSISWSTCMNFWSHSSISVVFLRESKSSSGVVAGSFRWCSHHSRTFLRTASLTCISLSAPIYQEEWKATTRWAMTLKTHVGNWNVTPESLFSKIVHHVLDEHWPFSNLAVWDEWISYIKDGNMIQWLTNFEGDPIIGNQSDLKLLSGGRHDCLWLKVCSSDGIDISKALEHILFWRLKFCCGGWEQEECKVE